MLLDSHSHIHDIEFDDDRDAVITRMHEMQMGTIVVGCDLGSSKKAVAFAEKESNVWATIGLHPTTTDEDFSEGSYVALLTHPKVVGIGECGLDYFRLPDDVRASEMERQERNFRAQIACALKYDKGLMLHVRPSKNSTDAHDRALTILREYGNSFRGTSHFFTSTPEVAAQYIALGFCVSFPGVITFAPELEKTVRSVPISSVLLETDSPYAAPVPHRGKKNEPPYVSFVAKKIAEVHTVPLEEVIDITFKNACRAFKLGV